MNKKETRSQRLQRRRNAIINATYNAKLADKAKFWSDDTIFNVLGIKVGKKEVRKANLKNTGERLAAQRLYESDKRNFDTAKKYGYTTEQAYKARKLKDKDIHFIIEATTTIQKAYGKIDTRQGRLNQWKVWASKNNADMPEDLKTLAFNFNAQTSKNKSPYDPNAKYGFSIVYYMYVEGYSIQWIKRHLKPDQFDGDQYKVMKIRKRR